MSQHNETLKDSSKPVDQAISPGEIIIGELVGIDDIGRPQVIFGEMKETEALIAMTTQEITRKQVGRQVALLFANGETRQPVIVGLIHNPLSDILENFTVPDPAQLADSPFPELSMERDEVAASEHDNKEQVIVDGKRVTIQGAEEVTLKCGKASITLTKAGKILIRGTYLSNRSSGVNRILGGSVQIN